jgi:hypothetical protein
MKRKITYDIRWEDNKREETWYQLAAKRAIQRGQIEYRPYFDRNYNPRPESYFLPPSKVKIE